MVNCPNCRERMARVVDEFVFECQKCGKRLTHAEILNQHIPKQRRIIRVPANSQLLGLSVIEREPSICRRYRVMNPLPPTTKYMGASFDQLSLNVNFFFEDDSFKPVAEGEIPPVVILEVMETCDLLIPERFIRKLVTELECLDLESGLSTLESKLRDLLNYESLNLKWSDLDGAQTSTERREEGAGEEKTADSSQEEGSEGNPQER